MKCKGHKFGMEMLDKIHAIASNDAYIHMKYRWKKCQLNGNKYIFQV